MRFKLQFIVLSVLTALSISTFAAILKPPSSVLITQNEGNLKLTFDDFNVDENFFQIEFWQMNSLNDTQPQNVTGENPPVLYVTSQTSQTSQPSSPNACGFNSFLLSPPEGLGSNGFTPSKYYYITISSCIAKYSCMGSTKSNVIQWQ